MDNYFFCDNNEETIKYLMGIGWENHILPNQIGDSCLMCFFNKDSPNHIFAIDLSDTPTKRQSYIEDAISFLPKYTLLSSLGLSLQEILDTCKEDPDVVNN